MAGAGSPGIAGLKPHPAWQSAGRAEVHVEAQAPLSRPTTGRTGRMVAPRVVTGVLLAGLAGQVNGGRPTRRGMGRI